MTSYDVANIICRALVLGDTNRAITETPMNMASSRSHCIFTMNVERRESGSDTVRRAKAGGVIENKHSTDVEPPPPPPPPRVYMGMHPGRQVMLRSRFECLFSMTLQAPRGVLRILRTSARPTLNLLRAFVLNDPLPR